VYAHENGCPWAAEVGMNALEEQRMDCWKYAHENGCPWHPKTCEKAAVLVDTAFLKYAHESGCPWDAGVIVLQPGVT
jgi:hypothetical protein